MKKNFFLFLFSVAAVSAAAQPYKDPSLSFEERARDLVSRMTNEEKVSQMTHSAAAVERLGIPRYNWWNECLHGVGRSGNATVFPQAIGMAAMWDREMMSLIGTVISDEARAKHQHYVNQDKRGIYNGLTFWTPNINIFRDPRWGRGMETYGEDPYLTGELAVPFIRALQGDDPKYLKVAACAKHFVVHSGPEFNRHSFNALPGESDFIETYTPHFKKAVERAHVESVMCAYNRLNGKPCCGSPYVDSLLRQAWGFKGHIVSDCWALTDIYEKHHHNYVDTPVEAAAYAIKGGTDLNCGVTFSKLNEALERGLITQEELDRAVTRLMVTRMKLGLFAPEGDVAYEKIPYSVIESPEHLQLAKESALRSIVLLKNDDDRLPISKEKVKRVAVIGPNADDNMVLYANYNGYSTAPKTLLKGLRETYPEIEFVFAPGVPLADEMEYTTLIPEEFLYTDESLSRNGMNAVYFGNKDFAGTPIKRETVRSLDIRWFENPPVSAGNDDYSVRWTGYLVPRYDGEHRIGLEGYSGRIYLNDSLLLSMNAGRDTHGVGMKKVMLKKGEKYKIAMELRHSQYDPALLRLVWSEPKEQMMAEAVKAVESSDFVIYAMGLSPSLEGEEMGVAVKGYKSGDRIDIGLPACQQRAMETLEKLGKPSALVLFNGSALAIGWEKENIGAIVEAWYPGAEGGTALAEILFGDSNPSGRLPVTFYASEKDLPDFENYNMEGRTYRYFKGEPLFGFGHGLSYTTFEYGKLKTAKKIATSDSLTVTCRVTNTGKKAGREIVQLYVSHPGCKYPVPVRSLKGFQTVELQPSESKTVTFTLHPEELAVLNGDKKMAVTEGTIEITVGGSQPSGTEKDKTHLTARIGVQGAEFLTD